MKFQNLSQKHQKLARELMIIFTGIAAAVFVVILIFWPKWGIAGLVLCLFAWDFRRRQMMPVPAWYLSMEGATVGPYKKGEIETMAAKGMVQNDMLACKAGDENWHPLGHLFPKLKCLPAEATIVVGALTGQAPPIRDGCLHSLGSIILILGVLACFTVIGMPLGVPMVLVGGVLMIAAK